MSLQNILCENCSKFCATQQIAVYFVQRKELHCVFSATQSIGNPGNNGGKLHQSSLDTHSNAHRVMQMHTRCRLMYGRIIQFFLAHKMCACVCVRVCRLQMCKREYNGHIMAATASVSLRQTFTNSIILTLHPIFYYICNICTGNSFFTFWFSFCFLPTHRLKEAFT